LRRHAGREHPQLSQSLARLGARPLKSQPGTPARGGWRARAAATCAAAAVVRACAGGYIRNGRAEPRGCSCRKTRRSRARRQLCVRPPRVRTRARRGRSARTRARRGWPISTGTTRRSSAGRGRACEKTNTRTRGAGPRALPGRSHVRASDARRRGEGAQARPLLLRVQRCIDPLPAARCARPGRRRRFCARGAAGRGAVHGRGLCALVGGEHSDFQ